MDAVPANALLKTLEEPANYNTFILISDRAHSLLDTIRSRCQTVRFSSLDPQIVAQMLESEGLGARDAHILASACGGSTTTARALNELGFVLQAEEWLDRYLSPLSQVVFTPGDVVDEVAQLSTNHRRSPDPGNGDIALLFRTLRLGLRDAILVGQGLAPERLTWPERYESALALYRALDAGPLIKLMERIADASQLFDRPLNTTLILEDLLLRVLVARRRASRQVA
jgi:DNA polymerase-3 subunit delta'